MTERKLDGGGLERYIVTLANRLDFWGLDHQIERGGSIIKLGIGSRWVRQQAAIVRAADINADTLLGGDGQQIG